jgi:hypothetical protein
MEALLCSWSKLIALYRVEIYGWQVVVIHLHDII